jgi:single-strand DNA-binding protein
MAGSLNRVDLIGNLTRDPDVRSLQDGSKVVSLSVATNEAWRDKNSGERRERAEFHRVVVFNEGIAKVAEQYLRKGSHVYLSGQLQTRKWTDQSGTEKYTTEIVLQRYRGELTMLGGRGDGEARGGDQGGSAGDYRSATSGGGGYGNAPDDLGSVPF